MKRRFSTKGGQYDSPEQRPGFISAQDLRALKGRHNGCSVPSGLGMFLTIEPRALPWAGMYRPFGATTQAVEFLSLKQAVKANLRGLGYGG